MNYFAFFLLGVALAGCGGGDACASCSDSQICVVDCDETYCLFDLNPEEDPECGGVCGRCEVEPHVVRCICD